MGFKDYCNTNNSKNENFESKKVEDVYEKYKDKNEDELLSELYKNINIQKQNGTFNYESLVSAVNKISPFLNNEQKLKIKDLLEKIK